MVNLNCLRKMRGVFWIVEGELKVFPYEEGSIYGVSKSGDNYNHRLLWTAVKPVGCRIAYHVAFDDYNEDELCSIADLIAKKRDLILADDAREKLHDVFGIALKESDFGNGRYVRNVIEKAKIAQASRLLASDYSCISCEDIKTIVASDIEMPVKKAEKMRIGFCA